MASTPTSSTSRSDRSAICEHCGTNTGLERIDATKLNELLESLRCRLSRDVHGNFFVEGSKTGKDGRHGQLGDLFSLTSRLENFKVTMDNYIRLHSPKETVKPEKPVGITKNMTDVIKEVVEQQVSDRLRDLSIRCGRLEEAIDKKDTTETKRLAVQLKKAAAAGAPVKVACDHVNFATTEALSTLTTRVEKAMESTKRKHTAFATTEKLMQLETRVLDKISLAQQQQAQAEPPRDNMIVEALDDAVGDLQKWQADIDDWKGRKNVQAKDLETAIFDLEARKHDTKEWKSSIDYAVNDLEAWKGNMINWEKTSVSQQKRNASEMQATKNAVSGLEAWRDGVGVWKEEITDDVQYLLKGDLP